MTILLDRLGIEIAVSDFQQAIRFYTEVLKFEIRVLRQEAQFAQLARGRSELEGTPCSAIAKVKI